MRLRSFCTLILACCVALATSAAAQDRPLYIGSYIWKTDDPRHGGFSAIEITPDGKDFVAISDHGAWVRGSFQRDEAGGISAISAGHVTQFLDDKGLPLKRPMTDAEGVALAKDGTVYVSFEGPARVLRYKRLDGPSETLPIPREFRAMKKNAALEGLAISPAGDLYTLPEESRAADTPFPVYRFRKGKWDQPFAISRSDNFLAVGADFGPDGKLYLLERQFRGIMGFASRVRRFDIAGDGIMDGEVVLQTRTGQHDNLEGIAVWRDAEGLRLTMIADDNFHFILTTEIVEYRIPD